MPILVGDCIEVLATLPSGHFHTCITSPPYWGLRDYGTAEWEGGDAECDHRSPAQEASDRTALRVMRLCPKCGARKTDKQLGLEPTPAEYVAKMVAVFREVRRVLRDDASLWLNLGSSYASGDIHPSQSPLLRRASACDTDGTARQGSQCDCLAGHGSDDEHPTGTQTRRDCNTRTDQPSPREHSGPASSSRDSAASSESEPPAPASLDGVPSSTMRQSSCQPSDASDLGAKALASRLSPQTSCGNNPWSAHMGDCTPGTSSMSPPLAVRTQGKESFFSACGRSDCQGIGRCGFCWCSLAIPSLAVKQKDLVPIPWLVALALQADGWYLRQEIIWSKPNPMPESVTDRCTKAHESIFLLTKKPRYYYDQDAIREPHQDAHREANRPTRRANLKKAVADGCPTYHTEDHQPSMDLPMAGHANGRNKRSVWTVSTRPFSGWSETYHLARVEPGDASGGTNRIESPGCPVHDRQDRQDGGRSGDHPTHTGSSGTDPVQEQPAAPSSASTPRASLHPPDDSGSQAPGSSQPAKPRSNRTRKTGHAPATTSPCTPSGETPGRTDGTSGSPDPAGPGESTPESRTWPDEMAADSLDQTPHHTVRKSSLPISPKCTCVFYHKITKKTSHFATFPPKLIEPCVLAGTSAKGCCPECGAPWERVVERKAMVIDRSSRTHSRGQTRSSGTMVEPPSSTTTGWEPACQHDQPPEPCRVLDPFGGAGTTGMVAAQHGRDYTLIELNPEYAAIAEDRVGKAEWSYEKRRKRFF